MSTEPGVAIISLLCDRTLRRRQMPVVADLEHHAEGRETSSYERKHEWRGRLSCGRHGWTLPGGSVICRSMRRIVPSGVATWLSTMHADMPGTRPTLGAHAESPADRYTAWSPLMPVLALRRVAPPARPVHDRLCARWVPIETTFERQPQASSGSVSAPSSSGRGSYL